MNKDSCISQFDPTRKKVGQIYNELPLKNTDPYVEAGDLARELTTSLVDDLNDTIASNPFEGDPFYITVYEKKDLQMKRALLRRLYVTKYRPYPEDDTVVFYVEPRSNNVKFCWCLPHHTEMPNILANPFLFDKNLLHDTKAWMDYDMQHFGFDMLPQMREIKGKPYKVLVPVPSKENRDYYLNKPQISSPTSKILTL